MQILTSWFKKDEHQKINKISKGVYLINKTFVLKEFTDRKKALREEKVLRKIKSKKILIPELFMTETGEYIVENNKRYYFLQKYIRCDKLDLKILMKNPNIIISIGEAISEMHLLLNGLEVDDVFSEYSFVKQIKNAFDGQLKSYLDHEKEFYKDFLDRIKRLNFLPKQLIHRDIHLNNLIFKDNYIGFIDYSLVEINHRIFDICYFVTSLLTENSMSIKDIIIVLKLLVQGYLNINCLSNEEIVYIPEIILAILYIATSYFIRIKKYRQLALDNINAIRIVEDNFSLLESFVNQELRIKGGSKVEN